MILESNGAFHFYVLEVGVGPTGSHNVISLFTFRNDSFIRRSSHWQRTPIALVPSISESVCFIHTINYLKNETIWSFGASDRKLYTDKPERPSMTILKVF